jgi:hypothetical protein
MRMLLDPLPLRSRPIDLIVGRKRPQVGSGARVRDASMLAMIAYRKLNPRAGRRDRARGDRRGARRGRLRHSILVIDITRARVSGR